MIENIELLNKKLVAKFFKEFMELYNRFYF